MTLDETRDALAEMDGWRIFTMPSGVKLYLAPGKPDDADCQVDCPHPPTLDGADAAIPRCVYWERAMAEWFAYANSVARDAIVNPLARVPDTGDKIADLYALALACRKAMEGKR